MLLVGRRGGVAEALLERSGIPLETLEIHGLDLTRPGSLAGFTARLPRAVREARRLIRRFRPDTVVGAAGYVSVPVVLAAGREGVPVLLLEQNAQPGGPPGCWPAGPRRWRSPSPRRDGRWVPPASRSPATPSGPSSATARPPLGSRCSHLLVWGGARRPSGSTVLSCNSAAHLLDTHPELEIAHQCGQLDEQEVLAARAALDPELGQRSEVSAFFADAAERVGWADLVVMRAGGSSLAEVSAMGRP